MLSILNTFVYLVDNCESCNKCLTNILENYKNAIKSNNGRKNKLFCRLGSRPISYFFLKKYGKYRCK